MERDIDINEFKVLEKLRKGAYHIMKCVSDEKDDMKVELIEYEGVRYVLKSFFREKVLEKEARIDEIINERDLLKAISYPNLNRLVQTTKSADWLCLVLQLAEGVDLVSLLRVYKALPEALVKLILLQLTYVLEYLHS